MEQSRHQDQAVALALAAVGVRASSSGGSAQTATGRAREARGMGAEDRWVGSPAPHMEEEVVDGKHELRCEVVLRLEALAHGARLRVVLEEVEGGER